jgi:hypothetical protein
MFNCSKISNYFSVLLIIWRFIIRPIFVKVFKWGVKEGPDGKKIEPEFPFDCKGNKFLMIHVFILN